MEGVKQMSLSVIIPFCPDGGRRDQNFNWVTKRLQSLLPDAEIMISIQEEPPFNRSLAINNGAKMATGDILLFCDADMIFDKEIIENSLKIVYDVPWVAPMNQYKKLTWRTSNDLLRIPADVCLNYIDLNTYGEMGSERCHAGAMFMITKENFIKTGGFDERFLGWGYEDNAFELKAEMIIGKCVESSGIAYHLWHPISVNHYPDLKQKNKELYMEYLYKYKQTH
jgi:predicted glycosyltransferase involved in capsule biosynthesis